MNVLTVYTGQRISVTAVVTDEADQPVAPTNIQFTVVAPDETNPAPDLTGNPATGLYTQEYILSQRGTYGFQIDVTNPDSSYNFNVTTRWGVT